MFKIFAVIALFAAISAQPVTYQAASYSSLHENQRSVQHLGLVSKSFKYAIPSVTQAIFPAPVTQEIVPVAAKTNYAQVPAYSAYQEKNLPAKYEYTYGIQDPHTGDYHSQQEQRDGNYVVGQYTLREADGTIRIVKYSDNGHGFNAVVEKQGHPTETPAIYKKFVAVAGPQYRH